MSLARGFRRCHTATRNSRRSTSISSQFSERLTFVHQQYSAHPSSSTIQRRAISLPKLPLSPMVEDSEPLTVNKVSSAIENLVTEWRIMSRSKDPATTKYPSFSSGARTIINESIDLLQSIENSSWYRADNPYAVDQLEKILSDFKKHQATMSKKELGVVEPLVTKAEFVYQLWDRVYFAFNILSDMYNRYHNQGMVVDESPAMKEIYEEYQDLMAIVEQSEKQISWVRPSEMTPEDVDKLLNAEEKELLKQADDDVLAKVRYHMQLNSFDEYELVKRRVHELLVRLDYFRGQSGIAFKGMDLDVFK